MFTLPPIAAGHCARGNAGAKVHFPHLACVRKVLEACLQGAVGPGSRGGLWIPIAPAIRRNVPGGFRCLVPTGVGVSAFGDTDSGCQCTRSGPTAKSRPSGVIFYWVLGEPRSRGGPSRSLLGALESVLVLAEPH